MNNNQIILHSQAKRFRQDAGDLLPEINAAQQRNPDNPFPRSGLPIGDSIRESSTAKPNPEDPVHPV